MDLGFGERAEFMASAEREPILGIWGLYPRAWRSVAKPLVESVHGAKSPEADEFSANEI